MTFSLHLKISHEQSYSTEYDNLVVTDKRTGKSYSIDEWNKAFPSSTLLIYDSESEDDILDAIRDKVVFAHQIPPDFAEVARLTNLYQVIWEPNSIATTAGGLIPTLYIAINDMSLDSIKYKIHELDNGLEAYERLAVFAQKYLDACIKYPDAKVWKR